MHILHIVKHLNWKMRNYTPTNNLCQNKQISLKKTYEQGKKIKRLKVR